MHPPQRSSTSSAASLPRRRRARRPLRAASLRLALAAKPAVEIVRTPRPHQRNPGSGRTRQLDFSSAWRTGSPVTTSPGKARPGETPSDATTGLARGNRTHRDAVRRNRAAWHADAHPFATARCARVLGLFVWAPTDNRQRSLVTGMGAASPCQRLTGHNRARARLLSGCLAVFLHDVRRDLATVLARRCARTPQPAPGHRRRTSSPAHSARCDGRVHGPAW
jgi:hypothetical protein